MPKNSGQAPSLDRALQRETVFFHIGRVITKIVNILKRHGFISGVTENGSARLSAGQSLVEIIIAISIASIIITSAAGGLLVVIRSNEIAGKTQVAAFLAGALGDNLISVTESNWHNIYDLNKGVLNKYYIATSTGQLVAQSGEEKIISDGIQFTRYFFIENVERDVSGNIGVGANDPSTQKAIITVKYLISGSERTISEVFYLTRWKNMVFRQTDWFGGSGQDGPISVINNKFYSSANMDYGATPGKIFATSGGNCNNDGCELISSTFDSGAAGGAAWNTIMWQGTLPSGATARFKIASSNSSSGPWNWPEAPLNPAGPNVQAKIDSSNNNMRYFRYKILLEKNGGNESPQVEDVIINYSL